MSEWFKRLIEKHTCVICDVKLNKKDLYTVIMDTAEGAHSVTMCETHALEFDEVLKAIEDVHNEQRL